MSLAVDLHYPHASRFPRHQLHSSKVKYSYSQRNLQIKQLKLLQMDTFSRSSRITALSPALNSSSKHIRSKRSNLIVRITLRGLARWRGSRARKA